MILYHKYIHSQTINRGLLFIVVIGCILRFAAAWQTQAIVQDGPLYIFQAKAIFNQDIKQALTCLPYLSSYPFLIALFFPLTQDWLRAAQLVSVSCGVATILPVYFLVRRLVTQRAALITATIIAILPVMVGISTNVLRDSSFWFLIAMGLYLFVKTIDEKNALFPVCSGIFFLLALWTRIEGIVFLVVSIGFLFLGGIRHQRIKKSFLFLMPFFASGVVLLLLFFWQGVAPEGIIRIPELTRKFLGGFTSFSLLREQLTALINLHPSSSYGFFLAEARNSIWLVGLGVLLNRFLESLCYMYALFILAGFPRAIMEAKNDRRVLYLLLCCGGLLVMFYYQTLANWILFYRMMATVLLPACIIMGYGADRIFASLTRAIKIKESLLITLLIGFLILFSLPKNFAVKNTSELIFRQIGETIAAANQGHDTAKIWSSPVAHRIVSFYANQASLDPPCPEGFDDPEAMRLAGNPAALYQHLKEEGFRFFVWEESFWREDGQLTPATIDQSDNYRIIGEWDKSSLGRVVIYELRE